MLPRFAPMEEMQRADPKFRVRTLVAVLASAIAGGAVILLLRQERETLIAWLTAYPSEASTVMLLLLGLGGCLPLLFAAIWTWRCGGRVLRENRFPPEGFKVIRDTPVLRGVAAHRRGKALQWISALFLLAAGLLLSLLVELSRLF